MSDDLCDRGQAMLVEALTQHNEYELRADLASLFNDIANVTRGSDLEQPMLNALDSLATSRRDERDERGPDLEQALKAVVG